MIKRAEMENRVMENRVASWKWTQMPHMVTLKPVGGTAVHMRVCRQPPTEGGAGLVYTFEKTKTSPQLAVKRFFRQDDSEIEVYQRLSRACTSSRVHGRLENVTTGYTDERMVFMEHAVATLEDRLVHIGGFDEMVRVLVRVHECVRCLQDAIGDWYTDLKPENVLVVQRPTGEALVLGDLGSLCGRRGSGDCMCTFEHPDPERTSPEDLAIAGLAFVAICVLLRTNGIHFLAAPTSRRGEFGDTYRSAAAESPLSQEQLQLPLRMLACKRFDDVHALLRE
jgi:hypothetical protein